MQALILNDDGAARAAQAMALFKRGFQVVTAEEVATGLAYAELGVFDLLLMGERVRGRLSHAVALAAEHRNPEVTTLLVTPRSDADVDELYELLPSLYGLLGEAVAPELVAQVAVAGVLGSMAMAGPGRRAERELEAAPAAPVVFAHAGERLAAAGPARAVA